MMILESGLLFWATL